jgi:hypothetical protein
MKQFIIFMLIATICLSYKSSVDAEITSTKDTGITCIFDSQCAKTSTCEHNGLNPSN